MVESQNRVHRQVFHINKDKRSSRRQPNARDEADNRHRENATGHVESRVAAATGTEKTSASLSIVVSMQCSALIR